LELDASRQHLIRCDPAPLTNNLATLYLHQGRLHKAAPLLARALAIRDTALGPDHPDTAAVVNDVAMLWLRQGRLDEAAALSAHGLETSEHLG
jgi:Flp pilus assembly protein TadD